VPVLCLAALAAATLSHLFDHSARDRVLKAHVNGAGEVDYAAIQRDRRDLDQYIAHKNPSVAFFDYDWAINDPGSRMRSANPLEREAARP